MENYLKVALFTAALLSALLSHDSSAKATQLTPIKPKIVGGELANEGDWPWMSALVYTFNEVSATLTVNNINYDSKAISQGIAGSATGMTVDCGLSDEPCDAAIDNICLIERGDINFSVKVENCQAGGGHGAIIYNNEDGNFNGTLGDDFTATIPVVTISQADGLALMDSVGEIASYALTNGFAVIIDVINCKCG
jgi:hypothetical protein